MSAATDVLHGLNEAQRRAVEVPDGALLILAGPGSGKTRVIAHRIAWLARVQHVEPWRILAVTFTNKAAREMRERTALLLGGDVYRVTLGTFHSVCARILRRDGEAIDLPTDFVIYDRDDQLGLVKRAQRVLNIDPKRYPPGALLSAISAAKNERRDASTTLREAGSYFEELVGRVFEHYQQALRNSGAVDFDDLLGETLRLFEQHPDVRDRYAGRYRHVLIDEFQDTNLVQYRLAQELASVHRSITAVGDPDQSIYSWRAADVRNLQHFERDFPDALVILLEQNYRSSGRILQAAHALIAHSAGRRERELWTENPEGDPIIVEELYDGDEEGHFVALEISRQIREEGPRLRGLRRDVPHQRAVARHRGGVHPAGHPLPHRRRHALLRPARDPRPAGLPAADPQPRRRDGVPARRQRPRPGHRGDLAGAHPARRRAARASAAGGRGDDRARRRRSRALPRLRGDIRIALRDFVALIDRLSAAADEQSVSGLVGEVLAETRYREHLERSEEERAELRWDNVEELLSVAAQYEDLEGEASLATFLEEVALVADVDDPSADTPDAVTLTTLHAAKGLEYPVVFMPGVEEGLLPHFRSLDDPAQMEEERRVCYVGMTRAQQRLYLTRARRRFQYGSYRAALPSRFIDDLPEELMLSAHGGRAPARPSRSARERRAGLAQWRTMDPAASDGEADDGAVDEPRYAPGDRVTHGTFGPGVVVSCELLRGDQKVTVAFEGKGVKQLLLSLAPLEPRA